MRDGVAELEEVIRGEISKIRETLVLFCGEKYKDVIDTRTKNLLIYVYNDALEPDRIKKVDLLKVAIEFAKDFTYDLELSEERKDEIELIVGKVLLNSYYADNRMAVPYSEIISYIKDIFSNVPELKDNLENNARKLYGLIEPYKKDYEVKDLEKKLVSSQKYYDDIINYSLEEKRILLKKFFGIESESSHVVNSLWEKMAYFKREMVSLLDEFEFKNEVLKNQAEFCRYLGAIGDNDIAIVNDARNKGIFPSDDIIRELEDSYNKNLKNKFKYIKDTFTNLDNIFSELDKRDIDVNKEYLSTYLLSSKTLLGMQICDIEGTPACIVFLNRDSLYSDSFIDTYFHEVIHYIGGCNTSIHKHRLVYGNDIRYSYLDEAFTNYLAKKCSETYFETYKYPNLLFEIEDNCIFNCTLDYMDEVFKLYKDELLEIHFSDSLSLSDIKRKLPFEEIANSVYKIKNAPEEKVEKITDDEIKKLIRGRK